MNRHSHPFVKVVFNEKVHYIPIVKDGYDINGNLVYLVKGSDIGVQQHHEYDRSVKIPNLVRSRKKGLGHYFRFKTADVQSQLVFMLKSVEQFYNKLKSKETN